MPAPGVVSDWSTDLSLLERFRKHSALRTHQTLLSSAEKLAWAPIEARDDQGLP